MVIFMLYDPSDNPIIFFIMDVEIQVLVLDPDMWFAINILPDQWNAKASLIECPLLPGFFNDYWIDEYLFEGNAFYI